MLRTWLDSLRRSLQQGRWVGTRARRLRDGSRRLEARGNAARRRLREAARRLEARLAEPAARGTEPAARGAEAAPGGTEAARPEAAGQGALEWLARQLLPLL